MTANIAGRMKDEGTPLYAAAQNGHLDVVLYLLTLGAQVDAMRGNGWTPLQVASQNGHVSVLRYVYHCMWLWLEH